MIRRPAGQRDVPRRGDAGRCRPRVRPTPRARHPRPSRRAPARAGPARPRCPPRPHRRPPRRVRRACRHTRARARASRPARRAAARARRHRAPPAARRLPRSPARTSRPPPVALHERSSRRVPADPHTTAVPFVVDTDATPGQSRDDQPVNESAEPGARNAPFTTWMRGASTAALRSAWFVGPPLPHL